MTIDHVCVFVCDEVLELSDNIRKQIPENIDYELTIKIMASDTSPLKTVLLQEVSVQQDLTLKFIRTKAVHAEL